MLGGAETQVQVREQKNPTRVVTRPVALRAAVIKNSGCYTQTPDFTHSRKLTAKPAVKNSEIVLVFPEIEN
ncbi:hypothetical protein EmuJ_001032700 [Echinococcus multilocularis]|uniref:Uncharacterized protein n=1 Tax=Echinococcus multilocularis TaxID=6211 RepID=A0A068YDI1_ECHMU|nr:hypothetical protein EmuJ_001032700 [Echinococcus multilocularis]